MLKKILLGAGIIQCCFYNTMAQKPGEKPVYTSEWGHLFREKGNNKDLLGIFSTEAPVYLLDSTRTQYKVQVSNGDIGFIDRQPLQKIMQGKKSSGEPAQYFYRGSQGQQCPHFYIQVSELRVRKGPTTESTPVRRAALNELVCIDYVPLYQDGWVYIGDHFHENPEYIQMKYLGSELTYEKVLKDYLAVKGKNKEKELTQVGRLREIAWMEDKNLKQALQYWKESNAGIENPKIDIDFEILLAEQFEKKPETKDYEKKVKALNMHFLWKETTLFDGKITDSQMKKLEMQKVNDIPDMPECGWEPKYFYKTPDIIVAFEEYKGKIFGSVYKMSFTNGEALVLGNERMDSNYDEKNFVTHFGDLLSSRWISSPHEYHIQNGDAGLFIFTFKDGKLFSYECMYFC
ncbi:Uncharacterised protein [Chryseobacterium gleum]|uniref:SH3 domain-containing protein n=2 Tax=Chryseobacterium gleum TaxID=250 RepID=A0A3S4M4D0_CHRGE|nr:hypothetical protein [Chryseobacterium gleum]QQY30438.1 hypothetical protein I6I60_16365 [Chryseobacterium gleum]VEE05232.1 Uncharacterised protein [Chryseobacterium gleum]